MHKDLGATMIYVTHDQVEAMTMADRIVVLNRGNIEQVGSPLDLYNSPDSVFVAGFIGSPKMNLISGVEAGKYKVHTIGIRPEHLTISQKAGTWPAKIRLAEHLGADTFLHVDAGPCGMMTVRTDGEYEVKSGATIYLTPDAARLHRFDKDGKAVRK
jgi:multiple sugar transport system ATP-binding protein